MESGSPRPLRPRPGCRDRAAAVARAERAGRRCAVLDDAFQHRRLARSLDLVLIPVEGPWPPRLLPRGPLREPFHALQRADWVLLTRRSAGPEDGAAAAERVRTEVPGTPVARVVLAPDGWRTLDGWATTPPRGPVLAVTGIARPRIFADLVRREGGAPVELVAFPDHHVFSRAELRSLAERAGRRPVAVTEKDAVRLGADEEAPADVRVLHLRVEVEEGEGALRDGILAAARGTASPPAGEVGTGVTGKAPARGGGPG
ncbi:MAG: hypothetical protein GWM92_21200 [Gemmatimonadetes bacterium]|nr:tetraacyldisaccharide 4'-kinase [Gemmatimonadota bacterium]NIR81377.1 tetraacyldisaccharide 4'-kinase [Gemmatimonadota bacterium]NIT90209.1 tetraacyldisaccharide 4'-kinase [Gemmatimonadota bacterium]NIU34037.1 tetraacyldisaccharide 4'-kinase [Gemmatimonadota bacterium]NIU38197.1 hypothetical protein [Gemmatimonadota bacterium]